MSINYDYVIERKRNRSILARWKILALLLILVIVGLMAKDTSEQNYVPLANKINADYIAKIAFSEFIGDDLQKIDKIAKLAEDEKVKAVLVYINSPGGSMVGSEMIYNAFRKIASRKPIVAVLGSVAASGGYFIALGADYIVAHNGTITGSIGVLIESAEVTEMAERLGIKFHNFKSGELKANPSFTEKLTPEAEKAIMDSIKDSYDYFVTLIATRRNLDYNFVRNIADGRIYSAKLALEYNLIDQIGSEEDAINWLYQNKSVDRSFKVREVKLDNKEKLLDIIFDNIESTAKSIFVTRFNGLRSVAS